MSAVHLGPMVVLVIAGVAGLLRPAEHVIRNSLIADTVPKELLANAVGFSRTTNDSARIIGALAGAGLLATLGIAVAYSVITAMYNAFRGAHIRDRVAQTHSRRAG